MLCALTLGLWWPWAVVRQYRMRVESITVHVKGWLEDIATDLAGMLVMAWNTWMTVARGRAVPALVPAAAAQA